MRFSSKTFKRRSRYSRRKKVRRTRRRISQRGGGDTFSRRIPKAAVKTDSVPIDEEVKESVSETTDEI